MSAVLGTTQSELIALPLRGNSAFRTSHLKTLEAAAANSSHFGTSLHDLFNSVQR